VIFQVIFRVGVGWIKRSGSTFYTFNFGGSASLDPPYKLLQYICNL